MTRLLSLCLSVLLISGCGTGGSSVPYTDHSRDAEAFALTIKQMVFDIVEDAKNSKEPAESLEAIVDSFEGKLNRLPVGDYRDTYEELLTVASSLYSECEAAGGRPPNLVSQLDELWAVADKLPGDLGKRGK
jgi:hypothetical protein